jgi:hypothetical protein
MERLTVEGGPHDQKLACACLAGDGCAAGRPEQQSQLTKGMSFFQLSHKATFDLHLHLTLINEEKTTAYLSLPENILSFQRFGIHHLQAHSPQFILTERGEELVLFQFLHGEGHLRFCQAIGEYLYLFGDGLAEVH